MLEHRIARVILALVMLCFVSSAAEAIPITNSSFETGVFVDDGNGTMVLPVDSTAITGWTVVTDQLAWIISPNPWGLSAQDGNGFLDLTAYPAGAPFGGVSQALSTSIGASYLLNYYLGAYTSRWGGPPVSILASAAGTSETCTVNTTSTESGWTLCSMNFTANSSSTTLSFFGTAGSQYIGLDNISVQDLGTGNPPIPEPATILLFGSGLVAIGRRQLRKPYRPAQR